MTKLQQLIFLNEFDLNKAVYRIFSFSRLEEIFRENCLTLVKTQKWDDPFENFILNSRGYTSNGEPFDIGFRDNFYGQCWSLTKESDAMWRIYSPNKDGVKIKTTIGKLIKNLYETSGEFRDISAFIGKVQYQSTDKLLTMLTDRERMSGKILDSTGRGQASTFFFKRVAFKHENEIRLIYNSQQYSNNELYKFRVNPFELIEEITFDPRSNKDFYDTAKMQLVNAGFQGKIIRSGLYEIPNLTVQLF